MTATSSVQPTFIDGHTDAAIPTPAFVANAAVGAQVSRDTFGLCGSGISDSGLQSHGWRPRSPHPVSEGREELTFSEQPPRSGCEQGLLRVQEKPSPSKPSRQTHLEEGKRPL